MMGLEANLAFIGSNYRTAPPTTITTVLLLRLDAPGAMRLVLLYTVVEYNDFTQCQIR